VRQTEPYKRMQEPPYSRAFLIAKAVHPEMLEGARTFQRNANPD
jgi:hypothetical protein